MQMTLYRADCKGNAANCVYPHRVTVRTKEEMGNVTAFDHVCAEYKDSYRGSGNFIRSDTVVMDIDNDHSEKPEEWVTEEKLSEIFADVDYMTVPSRNHMKEKDGKSARPKLHVYFPIGECTDADCYAAVKRQIRAEHPFFDDNALDAARFIFATDAAEVTVHDGWLTIDETLREIKADTEDDSASGGVIPEGSRNNTMSRFAGRVIKRYGVTEKAKEAFLDHAKRCVPPLSERELNTIWASAVRFFNKNISGKDGYVPPDEYNSDFATGSLKPEDYSDIGEAKVLVKVYGNELRYSSATDFVRFDGIAWKEDLQLAIGAIEEFLDLQLQDARDEIAKAREDLIAAGVSKETVMAGSKAVARELPDGKLELLVALMAAETYLKFVMKRRDYKYIISTGNAAKPMIAVDVNDLDADGDLLNTPFATFDLKKGMTGDRPHDSKDLITKTTNCAPGDEGERIWLDALDLFFCGDPELIAYVQETVGLAAIGRVYREHMIIAYGDGANGKSTFWNTVARVLGDYSGKLSAETLTMGCKRNVKPEMAELKGKRLVIASEMEEGMRLNTAVVKQLCSTDDIFAEKKYKAPFSFTPSHTLVLYTNHLPRVGANDDGIWRRLIVIPFNAKISGAKDIKNYSEYLYQNAGPAIMKWIIEGAQKVIAADYHSKMPSVVADAIKAYREENDWLGHFLADCCDTDAALSEKSGELYQQYRAYCIQHGEYIRSTSDFYAATDKAGFVRRKTNKGVMISGLQLKPGQDFL